MKKFVKFSILLVCISVVIFIIMNSIIEKKKINDRAVLEIGMTEGENNYFKEKLTKAIKIKDKFLEGNKLRMHGRYDEAVKIFEDIFNESKEKGYQGMAILEIADTYEKKRDYQQALIYVVKSRDEYISEGAKEPIIERAKYLEYAVQGNYEMTIKHAQLALEADAKLPSRPKGGREIYIDRLSDLKASKEYIESLRTDKKGSDLDIDIIY